MAKPVGIDVVTADQAVQSFAKETRCPRRFSDDSVVSMEEREDVVARRSCADLQTVFLVRQGGEIRVGSCAHALIVVEAVTKRDKLPEQLVADRVSDKNDRRIAGCLDEPGHRHDGEICAGRGERLRAFGLGGDLQLKLVPYGRRDLARGAERCTNEDAKRHPVSGCNPSARANSLESLRP